MNIVDILESVILSGLLIATVGTAFKLGHKDEKVDSHEIRLKEHDKEIESLKECNNDVKLHLASIETNILWIKEKLGGRA